MKLASDCIDQLWAVTLICHLSHYNHDIIMISVNAILPARHLKTAEKTEKLPVFLHLFTQVVQFCIPCVCNSLERQFAAVKVSAVAN